MARARAVYDIVADDKASPAFAAVNQAMRRTDKVAKQLGATLIGVVSGAGFTRLIAKSLEVQQELGKLNRQFGVSTELLSELRGVLSLTGVSWNSFITAVRNAQKVLADAEDGVSEAQRVFAELGIDFRRLAEFNPDEQVLSLLGALRRIPDAYRQSAAASRLFGFRANEVLRIVNLAPGEFARLREEQIRFGRSLSEVQTKAAEDTIDAWDRLIQFLNGLVDRFTNFLTPAIEFVSKTLLTVLKPAIVIVTNQFKLLGETIAGLFRAFTFAVQGEFSRAWDTLVATGENAADNVRDTFKLLLDPTEYINQQELNRLAKRGAQDTLDALADAVTSRADGPTLFDADFEKLKQLVSAYNAFQKTVDRGSAAEIDTTLQSLAAGVGDSSDPIVSVLKDIDKAVKRREVAVILEDIREILTRNTTTAEFA